MPVSSKQKTAPNLRHKATAVTGIYFSTNAKGAKTFECRYTNSEGRRVFETCGSFEAAKSRLAEISGKIHKGGVVANTSRTVASLIDEWQDARNVKPRTRDSQDYHVRLYIRRPLGRMKVRDVTRAVVLKWLVGLKRQDGRDGPLAEGTRGIILSTLSSILDFGVESELIAVNPCRALGRRQRPRQSQIAPRILGDGELEVLLAASVEWLRPIIRTSLFGALRLGEVCGLDWRDVDFERGVLVVRQNYGKDGNLGTPKGGRVLEIPLLPELRSLLREHYLAAENKSPNAPVFVNKIGGRRHHDDVKCAFMRARKTLSVEPRPFRFHDLRHTSISIIVNGGASPAWAQRFARHANLATTLGYVHEVKGDEHVEKAARALSGL